MCDGAGIVFCRLWRLSLIYYGETMQDRSDDISIPRSFC